LGRTGLFGRQHNEYLLCKRGVGMGYKTDYHLKDHINQKMKVLFNQLLCITMILYVHFTSAINQYRVDLELQNIISLYWTYDLELGCDAVLLPTPTLNCKLSLPCIGTHDLYWDAT
jgi:hypothetical protein